MMLLYMKDKRSGIYIPWGNGFSLVPVFLVRCTQLAFNGSSWLIMASSIFTQFRDKHYDYSHKPGDCTICNYYRVSKCSTFSLFTDTNLLSEIFNHVSLYMYVWYVRQKWQLKHVVTDGLSLL